MAHLSFCSSIAFSCHAFRCSKLCMMSYTAFKEIWWLWNKSFGTSECFSLCLSWVKSLLIILASCGIDLIALWSCSLSVQVIIPCMASHQLSYTLSGHGTGGYTSSSSSSCKFITHSYIHLFCYISTTYKLHILVSIRSRTVCCFCIEVRFQIHRYVLSNVRAYVKTVGVQRGGSRLWLWWTKHRGRV